MAHKCDDVNKVGAAAESTDLLARPRIVLAFLAGAIGGPIGGVAGATLEFLSARAKKNRERRYSEFLVSVESRLVSLESTSVSSDFFSTDEFYSLLEFMWGQISQSADEEKARWLESLFVGTVAAEAPTEAMLALYRRSISNMTGSHILVLKHFFSKQGRYSSHDRGKSGVRIPGELPLSAAELRAALSKYEQSHLDAVVADLRASGLIAEWGESLLGRFNRDEFFLTDYGLSFISFLVSNSKE